MIHQLKALPAAERLIVSLDVPIDQIQPTVIACMRAGVRRFRIGCEVINRIGLPMAVEMVRELGGRVMVDQMMIGTPKAMREGAASTVIHSGVDMLTVMANATMLGVAAAVEGAAKKAAVIGVSILPTTSPEESFECFGTSPANSTWRFLVNLRRLNAHGTMCSPSELQMISDSRSLRIAIGVQPSWAPSADHWRCGTPAEAILAKADFVVIGEPIIKPPSSSGFEGPEQAAHAIIKEIATALATR